jgi:phage repressor protein C with HTH and peptisase S24 domain
VTDDEKAEQREFIRRACLASAMTLDQMANRLDYKSLKRALQGEIPLPESKRRHIQDLVLLAHHYHPKAGEEDAPTSVHESDETSYGSDPRSILKRAREAKGWTHDELAKISRVPAQYIRDVESGAVRGSNEKQLRKLAKALELDADALMQGSDHPPIVGPGGTTFGAVPEVKTIGDIPANNIPLISMAQAGRMTKASFDDVYDHEGVIDYAKRGRKTFAVRIRGDSMEPRYPAGTIAIVEPEQQPRNERRVLAKLRSGDVLFKQLQFDGEYFRLMSLNPAYKPIEVRQQEIEWIYPVVRTQTEED